MSDSLASFAALFRAVLLLHGQQAPVAKPEVVLATANMLHLDTWPFERIFEFRASDALPRNENEANEIFGAYMNEIEQVIEAVDALSESSSNIHPHKH
jgi:hypothetical protein